MTQFQEHLLNEERIVQAIKDAFDLMEGGGIKVIRVVGDGSRHYESESEG